LNSGTTRLCGVADDRIFSVAARTSFFAFFGGGPAGLPAVVAARPKKNTCGSCYIGRKK